MKLFLYYALHSFKNQIKKLFRTWVAAFLAICFVFGIVIGIGAAIISDTIESNYENNDDTYEEDYPTDTDENIVLTEEDIEITVGILELVLGGITLVIFGFYTLTGDKNGSSIFCMADVNLLFSAPMKPQSVLAFRLTAKVGTALLASLYLLFQLPNLASSLSLSVPFVLSLLAAWFIVLIYGRLISVLVYTVASTHANLKKYVTPIVYGAAALIALSFYLYYSSHSEADLVETAFSFFNSPVSHYIPVWGWIKWMPILMYNGNSILSLLLFALLLSVAAVFVIIIWNIKADFYEDAMSKSEELAEKLSNVSEGRSVKRTRDRTEKLRRDGLKNGAGASVYFFKAMYNRFRFAYFGIITKTCLTYTLIACCAAFVMTQILNIQYFIVILMIFGIVVFYRALANPSGTDVEKHFFWIIPCESFPKISYMLLGGTLCSLLDIIPAMVISSLWLKASLPQVIAGVMFILSIDLFSSAANMLISLSLPVTLSQQVKAMIFMLFIYFGLIPVAAVMITGFVLGQPDLFMLISAAVNIILSAVCAIISGGCIVRGRK